MSYHSSKQRLILTDLLEPRCVAFMAGFFGKHVPMLNGAKYCSAGAPVQRFSKTGLGPKAGPLELNLSLLFQNILLRKQRSDRGLSTGA